jgi:hypothetical protein
MEENCKYVEYAVADSRKGVILRFGEGANDSSYEHGNEIWIT